MYAKKRHTATAIFFVVLGMFSSDYWCRKDFGWIAIDFFMKWCFPFPVDSR